MDLDFSNLSICIPVGHVDFNWAKAWVNVNGLLPDTPMSYSPG